MPRRLEEGFDPKLSYLKTFIKVVEEGGFRKAAKKLNLSPVAVMNHVKTLEKFFGVKLFEPREGLTPEGENVYMVVKEVVSRLSLLRGLVPDVGKAGKIKMTVYTTETPMEYLLPCFLLRFKEFNSSVDFQVEVGLLEDVKSSLKERLANVGLIMVPEHLKASLLDEFECLEILKDTLVAVFSPLHKISRMRTVDIQTLAKQPLILDKPGSDNRLFTDEIFSLNLIDPSTLNVKLILRGSSAITTAVSQGFGVGILPEMLTRKWVKAGLVSTRPLECRGVNLILLLIRQKDSWTNVVESLWKFAKGFSEIYGSNPPCLQRFTSV
ncbi:MAG: LysR family transcriptional regulator [Candidatus Bathyarchaeia archaeon]